MSNSSEIDFIVCIRSTEAAKNLFKDRTAIRMFIQSTVMCDSWRQACNFARKFISDVSEVLKTPDGTDIELDRQWDFEGIRVTLVRSQHAVKTGFVEEITSVTTKTCREVWGTGI